MSVVNRHFPMPIPKLTLEATPLRMLLTLTGSAKSPLLGSRGCAGSAVVRWFEVIMVTTNLEYPHCRCGSNCGALEVSSEPHNRCSQIATQPVSKPQDKVPNDGHFYKVSTRMTNLRHASAHQR